MVQNVQIPLVWLSSSLSSSMLREKSRAFSCNEGDAALAYGGVVGNGAGDLGGACVDEDKTSFCIPASPSPASSNPVLPEAMP